MANEVWDIPPQSARRPDVPRRLRLGLRIGVAALSFVILIGSGLAWATFQNFTSHIPHGAAVPGLGGAHDADGKDQNILLVGNDSRAGASAAELKALSTANDGGSVNTDTMMVLHVPANGGRASIISFPRDSWVSIPGHGKGKINSAYGTAYSAAKDARHSETAAQSDGIILTIKTINSLTGLHIDHYMQVNLLGFYRISNAIGGVTVCLNAAQNPNTDSDQFGRGYSGINLPKGVSVIKGSQALAFVRQRHGLPRGDLDRIQRQQYFLGAAFRKVTTAGVLLNPFKLHDLLGAVGSSLLVDPSLDLLKLGRQFQEMSAGNITFKTIPNDGAQLIYPDGVETSIVQVDTAAMPGFIRQLQGKNADPGLAGAKAATPSSVTVDVLNGTQTVGRAGRNADQLRALGFKVNNILSTTPSADTVIEYPSGKESEAKAVSGAVPGANLVQTSSVDRVTLVIGANGVQVKGLATSKPATGKSKPTSTKQPAKTSVAAKTSGLGCIN
ncbi:MAG: cpsA [Pseudonocardiales bacterium]|nr:cpsA [Pseudonocardiales bacterium]